MDHRERLARRHHRPALLQHLISTYIWIVTNRKRPERQGLVQLIDARDLFVKMKPSLGNSATSSAPRRSIAQLETAYGRAADTILTNHLFKASTPGSRTHRACGTSGPSSATQKSKPEPAQVPAASAMNPASGLPPVTRPLPPTRFARWSLAKPCSCTAPCLQLISGLGPSTETATLSAGPLAGFSSGAIRRSPRTPRPLPWRRRMSVEGRRSGNEAGTR